MYGVNGSLHGRPEQANRTLLELELVLAEERLDVEVDVSSRPA